MPKEHTLTPLPLSPTAVSSVASTRPQSLNFRYGPRAYVVTLASTASSSFPSSHLQSPLPPTPISAPTGASALTPSGLCCSRCHSDRSRENCRSLPRSSRAIGEVGSIPVWGWGCAAQLLSPSRLPVLGRRKEGGSQGAGPGEEPRRNRLGEPEGVEREPSGTCGGGGRSGGAWKQEQVRGWGGKAGPDRGEAWGGG